MNKPVYLGLSILEISKTIMYEFWYECIKPKYQNNTKLCYMDTDNFIIHIKTQDICENTANVVVKRFDTLNYEINRPLPKGKNKKVIGSMKDELEGKIKTEFAALIPKTYSCLMDDENNDQKLIYENCLVNNKIIFKSQQRFKSEAHNEYTEEITKIALSSNDDNRLQAFENIASYPYGGSAGKVYKTELLEHLNILLILMIIQMKIKQKIIQNIHIFQTIHIKY